MSSPARPTRPRVPNPYITPRASRAASRVVSNASSRAVSTDSRHDHPTLKEPVCRCCAAVQARIPGYDALPEMIKASERAAAGPVAATAEAGTAVDPFEEDPAPQPPVLRGVSLTGYIASEADDGSKVVTFEDIIVYKFEGMWRSMYLDFRVRESHEEAERSMIESAAEDSATAAAKRQTTREATEAIALVGSNIKLKFKPKNGRPDGPNGEGGVLTPDPAAAPRSVPAKTAPKTPARKAPPAQPHPGPPIVTSPDRQSPLQVVPIGEKRSREEDHIIQREPARTPGRPGVTAETYREEEDVDDLKECGVASPKSNSKRVPVVTREECRVRTSTTKRHTATILALEYPKALSVADVKTWLSKMASGAAQTLYPILHHAHTQSDFLEFLENPMGNDVIRTAICLQMRVRAIRDSNELRQYGEEVIAFAFCQSDELSTMGRHMLSELIALYCVAKCSNTELPLRAFLFIAESTVATARLCSDLDRASSAIQSHVTRVLRQRLVGSINLAVTSGYPPGLVDGTDFTTIEAYQAAVLACTAPAVTTEPPYVAPDPAPLARTAVRPRHPKAQHETGGNRSEMSSVKLLPKLVIPPSKVCKNCGRADGHRVSECTYPTHPKVLAGFCSKHDLVNHIANGLLEIVK